MQVRVLFFGVLREIAGQSADMLDLSEAATLKDVLAHYQASMPGFHPLVDSLAMSINKEYARPEAQLHPGDEVALLPPVSGGSADAVLKGVSRVEIVHEKIDTATLVEELKCPADGAVVTFEGVVRDNSRGRRTLFLDYEAYEEMAVKQMNGLVESALAQFPIRQVKIVHRLGRLYVGETSVLIVVGSAHRAAAFDACRWVIDTLKRTVPIWKKEHFEDGAVWADGEPFPADIQQSP
ncbi:MAG: molybdenum cofactor biosynthesis protein MoaE [Acidobacteriaceae bacterium]|nr:molybdenum cofactor biosynthesis protein MoaE [Acidobacteriaceae bacterium]